MKVDKTGPTGATVGARRTERASSGRPGEFSRFLDPATGPSGVTPSTTIGSVDALLAAQSVEASGEEERRQARKRGDEILDRLDELRHGMLAGTLTEAQLVALANLVRGRRASIVDPKMREILDEIELRAEVEIAKFSADRTSN